jgi:hypothetical protein
MVRTKNRRTEAGDRKTAQRWLELRQRSSRHPQVVSRKRKTNADAIPLQPLIMKLAYQEIGKAMHLTLRRRRILMAPHSKSVFYLLPPGGIKKSGMAPLPDIRSVLDEAFDVPKLLARLPALADVVDGNTANAILEKPGKATTGIVAPLNRSGDEQGGSWSNGAVTTPACFPEAYKIYAEGGWVGIGSDPLSVAWACPR